MPKTNVTVQLTGQDGNIFNVLGIAGRALKRAGHRDLAIQMFHEVRNDAQDYDHALRIVMDYVEVA